MKKIIMLLLINCCFIFGASRIQTTMGYSYTLLDEEIYHALEVGMSIVAIPKKDKDLVRPYIGIEINAPVYFYDDKLDDTKSKFPFFDKNGDGIKNVQNDGNWFGISLQFPLVMGLDIGGFYIQFMGGYNFTWSNNAIKYFPPLVQINTSKTAKVKIISQGYIYGLGIGYNVNENFTFGFRYILGSMFNKVMDNPSPEFVSIKHRTNYEKIMGLIGYSF